MIKVQHLDAVQGPLLQGLLPRHYGPWTLTGYRAAYEARFRGRADVTPSWDARPLLMTVNHNRWVASCLLCASGISTGRGWTEARCFECGAIYTAVIWPAPDRITQIEAVLMKRPVANRHWHHGETLEQLVADNIEHGAMHARVGG